MTSTAQAGDTISFAWDTTTGEEFMVAYYEPADDAWYTAGGPVSTRALCEEKVAELEADRARQIARFEADAADKSLWKDSRELAARMVEHHRTVEYRIVSRPVAAWSIVA